MWKQIGSGILVLALLAGCGKSLTTVHDASVMKSLAEAQEECYKAFKPDVSKISKEAAGYVILASQNNLTLLTATGHAPCNITNVYDAQIAEVKYQNEVLGEALNGLFDLGKWWVGAGAIVDIAGKISSYSVDGQFNGLGVTNEVGSRNSSSLTRDSYNPSSYDLTQAGGQLGDNI